MTTLEIIKLKNTQTLTQYKLVKGWVYRKQNGEKRFSAYEREDLFVEFFEEMQRQINASLNSVKMNNFLKELGFEKHANSTTSSYYLTDKGIVRISNHDWTSEKHLDPKLNLCSYEENGFELMKDEFNKFIK